MIYETRQEMLASLPHGLRCAELGVFGGDFSRDIIHIMQPSEMYLVDTFNGAVSSSDQHGNNRKTLDMAKEQPWIALEFSRWEVIKQDSVTWLKTKPAESLDFVYIDTTHSYEQTKAELREAMRAVRKNGWIAGHDYHERFHGVIKAVTELGVSPDLTRDGLPSFMFVNP